MLQAAFAAFLMVAAIGGAFYAGSENQPTGADPIVEPGLPVNTYMMLTYEVHGQVNGTDVNGSFGIKLQVTEDGGGNSMSPFNVTGNISGHAKLPIFPIGSGSYLDNQTVNTAWGQKEVLRLIGARIPWSGPMGLSIAYCGAESRLVYRLDLVQENGRLAYELVGVNITGMEDLDLNARSNVDELLESRVWENGLKNDIGNVAIWDIVQPPDGSSYRLTFNSSGFNFVSFYEQDLMNMANGGAFQYQEEWSLFGNGSLELTLDAQQLLLYMAYPDLDALEPMGRLVLNVSDG